MITFNIEEIVVVLYDGKFTRAVEAKVLKVGPNGKYIRVSFLPWANEEAGFVELKLKQNFTRKSHYSGYLKGRGGSYLMRYLGLPGDYYTLYKRDFVLEEGYTVRPYERSESL